jgi:hypothetical protein
MCHDNSQESLVGEELLPWQVPNTRQGRQTHSRCYLLLLLRRWLPHIPLLLLLLLLYECLLLLHRSCCCCQLCLALGCKWQLRREIRHQLLPGKVPKQTQRAIDPEHSWPTKTLQVQSEQQAHTKHAPVNGQCALNGSGCQRSCAGRNQNAATRI